jgi:glycosyltransferase involved in cell wall biosynthesis
VGVTVIVHNFSNTNVDIFRKLNIMGVILFSHRLTEVAAAEKTGIILDYIPLGIDPVANVGPKDIANKKFDNEALNIITTGFMRRHKGVRFLINAMPYVLNKFPKAHLTIQCALYPSDDSLFELKECKAEVKRLKLKEHVTFDSEFKEQITILENLKEADIAVLPYEKSNEGGSATASDCLSVGLPLIVSNAEIFDGIRDVVLTCEPEAVSIAEEIINLASSEDFYRKYSLKSIKYANANSCENIFGALLVKEL